MKTTVLGHSPAENFVSIINYQYNSQIEKDIK